jgi:hypothetical protein
MLHDHLMFGPVCGLKHCNNVPYPTRVSQAIARVLLSLEGVVNYMYVWGVREFTCGQATDPYSASTNVQTGSSQQIQQGD